VLELAIETGRKHQIRRHLSALGFPVVGDRLYGHASSKMSAALDLQLHAHQLSFLDPDTDARRDYGL
jgi:tRNA pseudouridine32 synthase/23S rRNA pseudouridine746 synthase